MSTLITCSVCGFRYDPAEHASCGNCPLHEGCTTACCPNCGTTNINPSASSWAVWLEKLLHRPNSTPDNQAAALTLDRIPKGAEARIQALGALAPDQNRHLQAYGLLPGRTVKVLAQRPLVIIQVEQTELALEKDVAREVFVQPASPAKRDEPL